MTLYLDSAELEDARRAAESAIVWGATTNPLLVAAAGRPAESVVADLCDILPGTVFHQLTAPTLAGRESEAQRFAALRPGRVGLKIPCTLENLALASRLAADGLTVGVTAVFSAAQAYLACQAGAGYVLPYVNRSTRLQGDGLALVAGMRAVIDACSAPTQIIAASIKSPEEATATVLAGAHHLTLPWNVIRAMAAHPLSEQAIGDFARASANTTSP